MREACNVPNVHSVFSKAFDKVTASCHPYPLSPLSTPKRRDETRFLQKSPGAKERVMILELPAVAVFPT